MTAQILLIDPLSTNRISLSHKLRQARYKVDAHSSWPKMSAGVWDAIIYSAKDICDIVQAIQKRNLVQNDVPLIAACDKVNPQLRGAFLEYGAREVFEKPLDEKFVLPRLRAIIRENQTRKELAMREDTNRALGLNESPTLFAIRQKVSIITNANSLSHDGFLNEIITSQAIKPYFSSSETFFDSVSDRPCDCIIVDLDSVNPRKTLDLILELRSQPETRRSAILIIADERNMVTAMDALGFGANDIIPQNSNLKEFEKRISIQMNNKRNIDLLRQSNIAGLDAAMTDPLTGAFNRRYATMHLHHTFEQSREKRRPMALILLDLDHFKKINDIYGHDIGDRVLIRTSETLKETIRVSDMLARFGGEEFLIILPNTDAYACKNLASRLCDRIAGMKIDGVTQKITASLGISHFDPTDLFAHRSVEQMLRSSDQAMYFSKENGRNQISFNHHKVA